MTGGQIIVVGHKGRDQWMRSFLAMALPQENAASAIALAARLYLHFNCKTGQCNPGNPRLVEELGVDLSTVKRAVRALERGGWISRHIPGQHKKVEFTLTIPSPEVTHAVTSETKPEGATAPSEMEPEGSPVAPSEIGSVTCVTGFVTTRPEGSPNGVQRGHLLTPHIEGTLKNTDQGARPKSAPPDRPVSVDRDDAYYDELYQRPWDQEQANFRASRQITIGSS